MQFLTAQLDDLAKRLEKMEKTLDSDSIQILNIQTNTPIPIHQHGKMSYLLEFNFSRHLQAEKDRAK
jgi:hypothetical protein